MLLGRDSEREAVSRLVTTARLGVGGTLVLMGEPGVGKTALLEDALGSLGEMRVLRATGLEAERQIPFAGLLQLLRPALTHLDQLSSPQSAALSGALALSEAGTRDGLEWLEAKPRDPEAGFDRIRMGFSATGIQAMELLDNFGQTTRLRFVNLQRNPKTDPADFRFEPPKDADVLGEK